MWNTKICSMARDDKPTFAYDGTCEKQTNRLYFKDIKHSRVFTFDLVQGILICLDLFQNHAITSL